MVEEGLTRPYFGGYPSRMSEEEKAAARCWVMWERSMAPCNSYATQYFEISRLTYNHAFRPFIQVTHRVDCGSLVNYNHALTGCFQGGLG